ncbi:hypothetical protein IWQ60_003483 [Tieghemiomyces parasiticus]|uniref:GAR domain-containing protein n=1 Tax=Tieghemiomyces parasiticus TaxID=78921 RepID=A0A9W8E015_9FUNG|nr:hypothetical protein IWQ60_003483 [Tieghemiomyces parasiticus]
MSEHFSYASDSSQYEDAVSTTGDTIDQVLSASPSSRRTPATMASHPSAQPPPAAPTTAAAALEKITHHSTRRRSGQAAPPLAVSLPQMLDNFSSGAREVELWLEAAKLYLDSLDIRSPSASHQASQEFESMMRDFTPTIELLCDLGDHIQSRIERIQASLPPEEQALRDRQSHQAKVVLHRILADWKIVHLNFGHIRKQLLETQYADELYGAVQQMQTDIRQYVGSVQAFERQWAATHAPCVAPRASGNDIGSADRTSGSLGVVGTPKVFLGIKTEKIQKQEDHALARLHQQVGSFEPRLRQLHDRVTKFVSIQPNHILPGESPFVTFQELFDAVVREWEELRAHLDQLKRRVVSERWVYIFEDLAAEIAADMNELVTLIQSTRSDVVKLKAATRQPGELQAGVETVRARFYNARGRPLDTVTKLFRHLAARYDKEVLTQRKPGLVRQYHELQQSWYEVQEALCHLEAEINHLLTPHDPAATGSDAGSGSVHDTESVKSSILDEFSASSVHSITSALNQFRIDDSSRAGGGGTGSRPALSPPPPASPSTSTSSGFTATPRSVAYLDGSSAPPPPVRQGSTLGSAAAATLRAHSPLNQTPIRATRKSFDAATLGLSARAASSLEVRRAKTPSMLPRPKTPARSGATSPVSSNPHRSGLARQPLPALPITTRTSPPSHGTPAAGARSKSRPTTPLNRYQPAPSIAGRLLSAEAVPKLPGLRRTPSTVRLDGSRSNSTHARSGARTPGGDRVNHQPPAAPAPPATTEQGLTDMDALLNRAKQSASSGRMTNYRVARLLSGSPVPPSGPRGPRRSVSPGLLPLPSHHAPRTTSPSGRSVASISQTLGNAAATTPLRQTSNHQPPRATSRASLLPCDATPRGPQMVSKATADAATTPLASLTNALPPRARRLSTGGAQLTTPVRPSASRTLSRPRSTLFLNHQATSTSPRDLPRATRNLESLVRENRRATGGFTLTLPRSAPALDDHGGHPVLSPSSTSSSLQANSSYFPPYADDDPSAASPEIIYLSQVSQPMSLNPDDDPLDNAITQVIRHTFVNGKSATEPPVYKVEGGARYYFGLMTIDQPSSPSSSQQQQPRGYLVRCRLSPADGAGHDCPVQALTTESRRGSMWQALDRFLHTTITTTTTHHAANANLVALTTLSPTIQPRSTSSASSTVTSNTTDLSVLLTTTSPNGGARRTPVTRPSPARPVV